MLPKKMATIAMVFTSAALAAAFAELAVLPWVLIILALGALYLHYDQIHKAAQQKKEVPHAHED